MKNIGKETTMSIASFEAAKKVCELSNWQTANLSLQKMLYFIHMFYIGENKFPLVNEKFEAWMYGPVLPSVYTKLKVFGADPIKNIFYNVKDISDESINAFLEKIGRALLKREPWELVTLTHNKDGAWAKNYALNSKKTISNEDILEEYRKRYEKEYR